MNADAPLAEADAVEGAPHPRLTVRLFGQHAAERGFLAAHASGRLHHAWLITGPRGVGKATLAWRIARFLLAEPGGEAGLFGDAAGADSLDLPADTPVTRRVAALAEPRLFLCRRPWDDKAGRLKQSITVDEVRRLKSFFNLSAADGGRRVAIVDAADEMNTSAANALLKILEEPPERAVLLLVSHRPMALLPTIRSRCRVLQCQPLGAEDLAAALAAAGVEPGDEPQRLAALAGGSVGEAVRLLSGEGLALYAELIALAGEAPRLPRPRLIALGESCTGKSGEARYDLTLRLTRLLLYRLAVTGISGPPAPEAAPGEAGILARLSPGTDAARRWADLAETLGTRAAHARAVNLDPASVILDMWLRIDQTAGGVRAA